MDVDGVRRKIMAMERPDRDAWWMGYAFYLSILSHDRETKNGAVVVDNATHRPVGTGYLGFPMGCRDHELPATRAGGKYAYTQHAEKNAALSVRERCADATLFCTLEPCEGCVGALLNQALLHGDKAGQSGIKRIVFWESRQHDAARVMLSHHPEIRVERYSGPPPQDALRMAADYMDGRPQDGLYKHGTVAGDYAVPDE
jgi:dCMP deaminase